MKKLALIALAALSAAHAAPTRTATEGYVDRTVAAATNGLATAEDVNSKADKATTLAGYGITDAVPLVEDVNGEKTAVTIGSRSGKVGVASISSGNNVSARGYSSHAEGGHTTASGDYSHAEGFYSTASGGSSHAEGYETTASSSYSHSEGEFTEATAPNSHAEGGGSVAEGTGSHAEGGATTASGEYSHSEGSDTLASGESSHAEGWGTSASGKHSHSEGRQTGALGVGSHAEGYNTFAEGECSHAEGRGTVASGDYSHAEGRGTITRAGDSYAFAWSGVESGNEIYNSHGPGTFNVNPVGGLDGFYIGEKTLSEAISDGVAGKADTTNVYTKSEVDAKVENAVLPTNPTFSNAVLAVGLNIDTNSVAVLNEIADSFGGLPIEGTATTVGGLLAALAAAVAWLRKNKVQTLKLGDNSVETSANGGVAKLDGFFTESNSLLTATIDARLPYPINAVPSTGVLKDLTLNTTSLASVTVPDNFTDLLIRASVASSLSVTMPEAITKYGDTFPGEAGEYLITITKTGASEAYVRTIKLEVANA